MPASRENRREWIAPCCPRVCERPQEAIVDEWRPVFGPAAGSSVRTDDPECDVWTLREAGPQDNRDSPDGGSA